MIQIKRNDLIELFGKEPIKNENGHNHLVKNILQGDGLEVMAYLVKKGKIKFTNEDLLTELDAMVEQDLLNIEQWEQMSNLLKNARNGNSRVAQFFKKKRRVKIV